MMSITNITNITNNDVKETSKLLFDSFVNDPYSWSVAVGFPLEKLEKWIESYIVNRISCQNPPSIVAKIEDKIVGICIMEDLNNQPDQPDNKEIDDMCNSCYSILEKNNISKKIGDIGYIAFIAVDKEYRRRNIAESMIIYSNKILKDLGYKYCIAFCTSYRSKRLFEKQEYKCLGSISYKDFTSKDGSKSFINMPDDHCYIMILSFSVFS